MERDTDEMMVILKEKYPHVAPILPRLEDAMSAVDHFNGGHGTFTIHMKKGIIPTLDVLMRHFFKEDEDQSGQHKQVS